MRASSLGPAGARERVGVLGMKDAHAPPPPRWSRRRTVAFIGLTCGGFWTCVVLGAAQLLR